MCPTTKPSWLPKALRFERVGKPLVISCIVALASPPAYSVDLDPDALQAIERMESPGRASLGSESLPMNDNREAWERKDLDAPSMYMHPAMAGTSASLTSADDAFWSDGFGIPAPQQGTNSTIWALLEFGDALVVGGDFSLAGNVAANRIARWDGTQWATLGSGLNGTVFALASYNGELIAGGTFTTAGGASATYIARWDGSAWAPLGAGVNAPVRALQVHDGILYVGGDFSSAGGASANQVAAWDGTSWSALGPGLGGGFIALGVRALTVYNGQVVAGGFFTNSGNRSINRIATWDGTAWQPVGVWTIDTVYSLIVHDGDLIAGSVVWNPDFGSWPQMIRRFDGVSWLPMGTGPLDHPYPNAVRWLAIFNGQLIATGQFPRAGGTTVNFVSRWDGTGWRALASGTNNNVFALAEFDGKLFAGGEFTQATGVPAQRLASWDGSAWSGLPVAPTGVGLNGTVWDLYEHGGRLIAGGEFTMAGAVLASRVAAFDGSAWTALGLGLNGRVFAFTTYQGDLVAGGEFTRSGQSRALYLARWDGSAWQEFQGGVGGPVHALTVFEDELVVGGDFESAGSTAARKIARWTGSEWQAIGDGFEGGFEDLGVRALVVFKHRLYVGGHFTLSGSQALSYIARWDRDDGSWQPVGDGLPAAGYALLADEKRLYAGSVVWSQGTGTWADVVRQWPGNWKSLGDGELAPPFPNAGRALAFRGGRLILGGQFPDAAGAAVNYLAKWDGNSWLPFGSGTNAPVLAVANFQGNLYVGGQFTAAGNKPSLFMARWQGPPDVVFTAQDFQVLAMEGAVRVSWALTPDVASAVEELYVERRAADGSFVDVSGPMLPLPAMTVDDLVDPRQVQTYRLQLIPLFGNPVATGAISNRPARKHGSRSELLSVEQVESEALQIRFEIAESDTPIRIAFYDIRGRLIGQLEGGMYAPGVYSQRWNLADGSGVAVPRGVYLVALESGSERATRKVVVVRP